MKMTILSYEDRQIMRICPDSLSAYALRVRLAKLRLRREFDRTPLLKFIRKILSYDITKSKTKT